ncbi:hypothetical protein HZS_6540 [Henneguya salminicola]|nr:hypothetical protein HZS_6540 [Henneguya salminicola]
MDIYKILQATICPNAEDRNTAIKFLESAAATNYNEIIEALALTLANTEIDSHTRGTAGLYLKNMLVSRSAALKTVLINKWLALNQEFREKIKDMVIRTLGTEKTSPSVSAQLISAIAYAEFPINGWHELLPSLTNNISNNTNQDIKEASIEAVGYICQDLPQGVLTQYSADLLSNIIQCMKKDQSDRIRSVATKALFNSLEFVSRNFEIDTHRNLIMQHVCESAVCRERSIRITGLQCLCKIVTLYYNHMEAYMTQALFSITFDAMKSEDDDIALQGIEFWSSLCEEEQDINLCSEGDEKQLFTNKNYSLKALPYIIPSILDRLCIDSYEEDEDTWSPHKAASVCLMLLSDVCREDISAHLLPFIGTNCRSTEPFRRDASMLALGALVDGVGDTNLTTMVKDGHTIVLELAKDSSPRVRDSSLWVLGKMYERHPGFSSDVNTTIQSLAIAYEGLKDVPRVATNACWTFYFIIKAMYDVASANSGERPNTLFISNRYENIISAVYTTIKRDDAGSTSLRAAAFELLDKLIECHPLDTHTIITSNLSYVLHECSLLFTAINTPISPSHMTELAQYQSLYCIVLQNYFKVLELHEIAHLAEPLIQSLVNYLKLTRISTVQEDVLLTFGVLIQFSPQHIVLNQITSFLPYITECLSNSSEITLCISASSVMGDICNAVGKAMVAYAKNIMMIIFKHFTNTALDIQLKSHLLILCGDLALALGPDFRPYLSETLELLKVVSTLSSSEDDDVDYIEAVDEIKSSCLETYTSILQGMYQIEPITGEDFQVWSPHISYTLHLIDTISQDPNHSDSIACSSCGLLGDLLHTFKSNIKSALNTASIQKLIHEASHSSASKTKTVGVWLQKLLQSV